MKYNIIGARYENNNGVINTIQRCVYATTKNERWATAIVDALNASKNESSLYQYSYEEVEDRIDEEKLDELAWCQWAINFYPDKRLKDIYANGFEDGYRKAKEE